MPGGVVLELLVDEALELAEGDDLVESVARLAGVQTHHHRVDLDVVASREVGVEARRPSSMNGDSRPATSIVPGVGAIDPGQALQQRALARAVAPDDAEELALEHLEVDPAQHVELVDSRCAAAGAAPAP